MKVITNNKCKMDPNPTHKSTVIVLVTAYVLYLKQSDYMFNTKAS